MLRPALELAIEVVKAGRTDTPPIPPPRPLIRLLGFAKHGDRALATVAAAIDNDDDLRGRVAASAGAVEDRIGRAGVLFLQRPEGWDVELREIAARAERDRSARADAAADRASSRRLAAAEEQLDVLTATVARLRDELAAANEALAAERTARAQAEQALATERDRISGLERERDAAHRKAAAGDRAAAAARAELDASQAAHRERLLEDQRIQFDEVAPGLVEALRRAVAAEADLRKALGEASAAVIGGETEDTRSGPARRPRPPRRQPLRVPPGLVAEAPETAGHFIRVPGVLLIVDGYNASLRAWSDLPLTEQRSRLVDALGELAARSGVEVLVVFDGNGDEGRPAALPIRRNVRAQFTAGDVEADDEIIAIAAAQPADRPVLVASDDRRVRRGAESSGANPITQAQLFALLGRDL